MQNNKIGSGFHNLGNTCFFNAVMQVIMYTPALANYFNAKIHSSGCNNNAWCIFCAVEKLWAQSKQSRVVAPNAIVSNLKTVFKKVHIILNLVQTRQAIGFTLIFAIFGRRHARIRDWQIG